jgi:hypothetical protein
MIYSENKGTVEMERGFLQADQKRVRQDGGQRPMPMPSSEIAVVSTPVGRAWNLADQLLYYLQQDTEANSPLHQEFGVRLWPG